MKLGDPERHQEGGPVKTEAKDAWGHQGLEKAGRRVTWSPRTTLQAPQFLLLQASCSPRKPCTEPVGALGADLGNRGETEARGVQGSEVSSQSTGLEPTSTSWASGPCPSLSPSILLLEGLC